jgi:hypothetical protein
MRCKKCGAIMTTWAIDSDGKPIYHCTTQLTSRGVDGSHGSFIECGRYYRDGKYITGKYVQISHGCDSSKKSPEMETVQCK